MDGERSSVKQSPGKPIIPLSLEDCCLAWLVSDLEHYPPELLALLPLRLRYRLLANVPVLDLCQLEHTSVAEGVDLESIWELKCSPWEGETVALINQNLRYIKLSSLSWRDRYLHSVANIVLNNSLAIRQMFFYTSEICMRSYFCDSQYYRGVVDWLISLKGYQFLNEDGDLQSSYNWQHLVSSFFFFEAERGDRYDRLTPPRYVHYKSTRPSDEELITLLLKNCHFKPKYFLFPPLLYTVSELLLQSEPCDILKEFLNEVEEMHLVAPYKFPNVPVVLFQTIFSGASPCKLRTLQVYFGYRYSFCGISEHDKQEFQKFLIQTIADVIKQHDFMETIYFDHTDRFKDVVLASSEFTALATALISFVARPQFRTLDIHNFPVPVDVVTDILSAFLVSPCSHQQTLKLPQRMLPGLGRLHPATPCPAEALSVPDSGVEYKELYLHQEPTPPRHVPYNESYFHICRSFFAFPKIRLRFLNVGCFQIGSNHCVNTLHMGAQHPDIQVKSLSILLRYAAVLPTLHEDMRALLQIPTLTSLSLPPDFNYGVSGNSFLPILARELPRRHHLAAIEELDLGRSNFLELPAEEVEHLFQSIFSLPNLSQLTLRMNHCAVSIHHYKLIHRLWTKYSSGERLKELVLGSAVVMNEKEYTDEFSVSGVMSLLDSMAQTTSVVSGYRQLYGVKTDLIKAKLKMSD